ncbi:MFS transporter [Dongshaea marina]|uniref:MFS transporter n=1 Tax=Dongshaea marina TaxID=2047966 RepID=UPI00131F382C|nr:MFS transporter [Dongshaea marina]
MSSLARHPLQHKMLWIAMFVISSAQLGIGIILPALPAIADTFAKSECEIQLLVTLWLAGFGLSQLVYGPWSDTIGRRPIFFLGQGIYLSGTLICFMSKGQWELLLFGRLLQGIGAGSASILPRCMLRDCFGKEGLTHAMSYLACVTAVMPVLAPMIGGYLVDHLSWPAVFGFVLCYLLVLVLVALLLFDETLPYPKRSFSCSKTLIGYWQLLSSLRAMLPGMLCWVGYILMMLTTSIYPFWIQQNLGLSASAYGQLMVVPALGLLFGGCC